MFVCLSVSNFAQKLPNSFAWHFQIKVGNGPMKKMIKFRWWSRSPSEYRYCFPGLSLLGDTESG